MTGYWKFHRAMLEHPIWKRPMATRLVWITILSHANFTDKEWLYQGSVVTIPAGTFITTQGHLASLAGVSRKQVRDALIDLIKMESIRANQRANRYTEICVINWPIYQGTELSEGQPKGQQLALGDIPGGPRRKKKEYKNTYTDEFLAFWAVYLRHDGKLAALKAWNSLKPDSTLQAQLLATLQKQNAARYSRCDPDKIPHASTWLNGRRWEDEIPTNGHGSHAPRTPELPVSWKCVECGEIHSGPPKSVRSCTRLAL